MDGVSFTKAQMTRRPVPIIIISIANEAGEQVLAALDAGAIDFLQKPTALATEKLFEIADELIDKVKAAAQSPLTHAPGRSALEPAVARQAPRADITAPEVVVIGASTGGPQALKRLISALPATCPVPIAIVLHMPIGYTEMYARKLAETTALTVTEAQGGEEVAAGAVFIAPAGRHLTFVRDARGVVRTRLDIRPLDVQHRPSVDVLFQSASEVFGDRVLAVVLTGMGADGRDGAAWIKAKGGAVLTEAEDSCVVYGMPRSVVEAGLSDESVHLEHMAQAIMDRT
jgi:two-component system chemotaxis response regulator CheB